MAVIKIYCIPYLSFFDGDVQKEISSFYIFEGNGPSYCFEISLPLPKIKTMLRVAGRRFRDSDTKIKIGRVKLILTSNS